MGNYRRRVTRIIWDFQQNPLPATKLPTTWIWFREYHPMVEKVTVELVGKTGHIYLDFTSTWDFIAGRPKRKVATVDSTWIHKQISDLHFSTHGWVYSHRGHSIFRKICIDLDAINGEKITYTAMRRCKELFECLGLDIKDKRGSIPLVCQSTQEGEFKDPDHGWLDWGNKLFFDVFRGMTSFSEDLSGHHVTDRILLAQQRAQSKAP